MKTTSASGQASQLVILIIRNSGRRKVTVRDRPSTCSFRQKSCLLRENDLRPNVALLYPVRPECNKNVPIGLSAKCYVYGIDERHQMKALKWEPAK